MKQLRFSRSALSMTLVLTAACGRLASVPGDGSVNLSSSAQAESGVLARNAYSPQKPYRVDAPVKTEGVTLVMPKGNAGAAVYQVYVSAPGSYALEVKVRGAGGSLGLAFNKSPKTTFKVTADDGTRAQRADADLKATTAGWQTLTLCPGDADAVITALAILRLDPSVTPPVTSPPVVTTPVPSVPVPSAPTPPAPTPPASSARELKVGELIAMAGLNWQAQTPNILFDAANNRIDFRAKTGEFAYFDPADGRKIRNEVAAMNRFDKNQMLGVEFDFVVTAPAVPHADIQWFSPFQIHQADTRDANGNAIPASPLFAIDILANPTGRAYVLRVRGETHTLAGGFANLRVLGEMPFEPGRKYHLRLDVVDTHGQPGGLIRVAIDGVVITRGENIPVGYAYVDTNVLYGGKPQDPRSYLKLGIYAGNQFRPADISLGVSVSGLAVSSCGTAPCAPR